jgi:ABC-type antimicrobial peptide transport system permease subunit
MDTKKRNILIVVVIILIAALVFFVLNNSPKEDKLNQLINKDIDTSSISVETLPFSDDQLLTINQINNSQEIIDFINSNISIKPQIDILTKQPSEVLSTMEGNKSDVASLINELLNRKGLYSSTILYTYTNNGEEYIDLIIPFRDVDEPRYIYFEDNGINMMHHGWSYDEMFKAEEARASLSIESYCIMRHKVGYMEIAECSSNDEVIRKHYFITED